MRHRIGANPIAQNFSWKPSKSYSERRPQNPVCHDGFLWVPDGYLWVPDGFFMGSGK